MKSVHAAFRFTVATLLAGLASCGGDCVADAPQPNVVFILADDAGYGDLACFGGRLPTPNLDRMAEEGCRLTQHYAGSTVCAPSRCVLLTGRQVGRATVRGNQDGLLTDGEPTIASVLGSVGYRSACIGKWGVGHPPADDDPLRCGFDEAFGYVNMFHAHNFFPTFLVRNGVRVPLRNELAEKWVGGDGRGVAVKRVDYAPELITSEALSFLDRNAQGRFFLYLAFNTPHANNEGIDSPRPELGMEVPDFGPYADRDWPAPEKGFAEMMRRLDRDVGRLLDKLDELGLSEQTLVVFSSDNGPHSEGGHSSEFFDSNGALRGQKRDLYEGGIRVPTIVRWPDCVTAAAAINEPTGFQDWMPTFCELAGADIPESADGVSLVDLIIRGDGHPTSRPARAYCWEFSELGGSRGVRLGEFKAVQRNVASDSPTPIELYNIVSDPGERMNLAADAPKEIGRLTRAMDRAHKASALYPLYPTEGTPRPSPNP